MTATVVVVFNGLTVVVLTALVVLEVVVETVVKSVVLDDGVTVVVLAASVVFELDEKKPITLSITKKVFVAFADDNLILV